MKQVILIRKDLRMPIGKACAQVAHASVQAVLNSDKGKVDMWISEGAKKIVLEISDLKELHAYKKWALKAKLKVALIKDAGHTFFKKPTFTCLAIGPDNERKIDDITADLKIL
ncbi:MAG: peptidyl-tRNA hydrolase Pth2 [archaeon]